MIAPRQGSRDNQEQRYREAAEQYGARWSRLARGYEFDARNAVIWSRKFMLTITREGARLFAQLTGQPRFEVFAESERKFFLKVVEAQLVFGGEGNEQAPQVTLFQNGREQVAKRTTE